MQPGHRGLLDTASKSAAHDELRAVAKGCNERRELAKVISQIGVAHNDPLAPDVSGRVNISPAKSSFRRPQHFAAMGERYLRSSVGGTIDDQDLAGYSCSRQPFLTPINELT